VGPSGLRRKKSGRVRRSSVLKFLGRFTFRGGPHVVSAAEGRARDSRVGGQGGDGLGVGSTGTAACGCASDLACWWWSRTYLRHCQEWLCYCGIEGTRWTTVLASRLSWRFAGANLKYAGLNRLYLQAHST